MKIDSNIFPVVINEVEKTSEIIMGKSYKKSFGQELAERQKENEEAAAKQKANAASENYANNANSSLASLAYQSKLASLQKKPEEKFNMKIRGGLYEK